MSKIIGRLIDVGVAKEAVRGTAVAPTFWLPKATVSVDDKVTKSVSKLSYGNIGMEGNAAPVTQKWAEGEIEADMFDKNFGLFLLAMLGTLNTTGPTDSLYTHTFSLQNDNSHDSLSIGIANPNNELMFKFAMLESLTLTLTPEEAVKMTAAFKSRISADWNLSAASYIAENKFLGRHLTFKLATLASGLDAASGIDLKRMTLKVEKRLRPDWVLGTAEPIDFQNQAITIEGEIELDLDGRTYRDLALDGSYRAARIDLLNQQALVGSSSRPQFTLDLSRVHFEGWEPAYPNDDVITQVLTFKALYDITNGNIINSCVLKNAQASY